VIVSFRVQNDSALLEMQGITIAVNHTAGVLLPDNGILRYGSGSGIRLSLLNSTGTDFGVVACQVESVGHFLGTPAITFRPPQADIMPDMAISFATNAGLKAYDTVRITLPGFEAAPTIRHFYYVGKLMSDSSPADVQVTWISGCHSRPPHLLVTMLAGYSISAGDDLQIVIDGSQSGIRMPKAGLRDEHHFAITTDVSSQSGYGVDRLRFQSIGSLSGSLQVVFMDVQPGMPASLIFTFVVEMELHEGDTIGLKLDGFFASTEVSTCIPVLSKVIGQSVLDESWYIYAPFAQATWVSEENVLSLHVKQPVKRQQHVEVIVPGSVGLSLPIAGINNQTSNLQVKASAQRGPMQFTRFNPSQSIGSFGNSTVLYYTCSRRKRSGQDPQSFICI
jgi:hypothetical protein